jgi:hypothetical protein
VTTQYSHSLTIAQPATHTFSIYNAGPVEARNISVRFIWGAAQAFINSLVTTNNFVCHTVGTSPVFELDCDFGILPANGSARITAGMVYQPPPSQPFGSQTIAITTYLDPAGQIVEYSENNNYNYATFTVTY